MDSGWVRRMTTRIVGTGSYVPEQIVTNDDLAKIVETNDEWIRSRTGIGARRIATSESTSYMAAEASIKALENAGVKPEEIDLYTAGHLIAGLLFSQWRMRGTGPHRRGKRSLF